MSGNQSTWQVLATEQERDWAAALSACAQHDFYHTSAYHRLAEERGEGRACLLVFRGESASTALPVLLRSLEDLDGLESAEAVHLQDATSVYGYAGPAISSDAPSPADANAFREALTAWMHEHQVVTLFARLHPLINQRPWLEGIGDLIVLGQTTALDLTVPEEEQVARYRKSHRREVRLALEAGITCRRDPAGLWRREFGAIYRETMARVEARRDYLYDDAYFDWLLDQPSLAMRLFVALADGEPVAGALFARTGEIAQYHLAGTAASHAALAPMKVIIDCARRTYAAEGARVLHLGGGLGSGQDSLFAFKAGFGGNILPFSVWRWTIDPAASKRLTAARASFAASQRLLLADSHFFPPYRGHLVSPPAHPSIPD